jgi:hypothetical protein
MQKRLLFSNGRNAKGAQHFAKGDAELRSRQEVAKRRAATASASSNDATADDSARIQTCSARNCSACVRL